MKKILKMTFLILVLLLIYVYILVIDAIPNNITRFQGEELNLQTILGLKINKQNNEQIMEVSTNEREQNTKSSRSYKIES